jgi:hypothetical protein
MMSVQLPIENFKWHSDKKILTIPYTQVTQGGKLPFHVVVVGKDHTIQFFLDAENKSYIVDKVLVYSKPMTFDEASFITEIKIVVTS